MTGAARARGAAVLMWVAVVLSSLAWIAAGYPWPLCVAAAVPLLAALRGLIRGHRYTYAWASLLSTGYLLFALTELLVNPAARWVAGLSLLLVFGWFCTMVAYLRISPAPRG